jgi:hypothetical protein
MAAPAFEEWIRRWNVRFRDFRDWICPSNWNSAWCACDLPDEICCELISDCLIFVASFLLSEFARLRGTEHARHRASVRIRGCKTDTADAVFAFVISRREQNSADVRCLDCTDDRIRAFPRSGHSRAAGNYFEMARALERTASRVCWPSTRRQMLRGFSSFSSSGRADAGKFW